MIPLPLKQMQALEKACFLVNYSLKQELNKSSSLRTKCHEVTGSVQPDYAGPICGAAYGGCSSARDPRMVVREARHDASRCG